MKKINPYTHLLMKIKRFCSKLMNRRMKCMTYFPKKDVIERGNYRLDDIYYRVEAANKCGYDVILSASERGLDVYYMERMPEIPFDFR